MAGQFGRYDNTPEYWTLTPYSRSRVRYVTDDGIASYNTSGGWNGVRPSVNLKSNVVITGGNGTKDRPFTLALQ